MRRNAPAGFNSGPAPLSDQISDLDRELQLLKRKREMFEQQQQMLSKGQQFGRQRQYDYEQPAQSYNNQSYNQVPPLNSDRPLSQLYDDGPETYSNNFGRQFGKKRQSSDNDWQSNTPSKRFYKPGNRSTNQRRGSQGPNPMSKRSLQLLNRPDPFVQPLEPLMSVQSKPVVTPRFNEPFRNDFRPSKVTKAKNTFKPKLSSSINSAPVEKRKILVAKAAELVKQDEDFVLRADKVPSVQMTGRLELALGSILKELKERFVKPPYSDLFNTESRNIKQTIRERIRSVMLGKVVGNVTDIIKFYRAKFPKHTDKSIMSNAMSKENARYKVVPTPGIEEADIAEKYFKENMRNLIEVKLTDMFTKVHNIYKQEYKNTLVSTDEIVKDQEHSDNPKVLEENKSKESLEIIKSEPNVKSEEKQETEEKDITEEVIIDQENDKTEKGNVDGENIEQSGSQQNISNESSESKYKEILDSYLQHHLPKILPRYKYVFMNMFALDRQFKNTKTLILGKLRHALKNNIDPNTIKDTDLTQVPAAETVEESKKAPHTAFTPLPYYVKVFGRPYLPKKKIMREFLNSFNTLSIKKHKDIPQLLFVGLGTKEDFDKILAANDTSIGNTRIFIKLSKDQIKKKEENTTADTSDNVSLTEELDNQITDLLTSIRKAEEEDKENTTEGEKEENVIEIDNEDNNTNKGDEVKATQGNSEVKTTEVKVIEGDSEVKATEGDKEVKAIEGDSEVKATEDDNEVKANEGFNEINTSEDDNKVKAAEAGKEIKTAEEANEINAAEGDNKVKAAEAGKEIKTAEEAHEINAAEGDNKVKAAEAGKEIEAIKGDDEKKAAEGNNGIKSEINKQNETKSKGTNSNEKVDQMLEDCEHHDESQSKKGLKQEAEETKEHDGKKADSENIQAKKIENKDAGKAATPMRASARLANVTPSTIKTRCASKLT